MTCFTGSIAVSARSGDKLLSCFLLSFTTYIAPVSATEVAREPRWFSPGTTVLKLLSLVMCSRMTFSSSVIGSAILAFPTKKFKLRRLRSTTLTTIKTLRSSQIEIESFSCATEVPGAAVKVQVHAQSSGLQLHEVMPGESLLAASHIAAEAEAEAE